MFSRATSEKLLAVSVHYDINYETTLALDFFVTQRERYS